MITGMSNGHKIEYENGQWVYSDTKESIDKARRCKSCEKLPTKEGYDGCLGYLPNVSHACCGHNIEKPCVVFNDGTKKEFEDIKELKEYFDI